MNECIKIPLRNQGKSSLKSNLSLQYKGLNIEQSNDTTSEHFLPIIGP